MSPSRRPWPPCQAREELAKLGPLSVEEQLVAAALGATLVLWVLGGPLGVSAVAAALAGLAILLITGARCTAAATGLTKSCAALRPSAVVVWRASPRHRLLEGCRYLT
jgi:di/tricarboxylate transporter